MDLLRAIRGVKRHGRSSGSIMSLRGIAIKGNLFFYWRNLTQAIMLLR